MITITKEKNVKRTVKLNNLLFPIWLLLLFPTVWLIVLPGNFIFDSIVLLIAMAALKITERREWYKKYILKIFIFGMLSDLIGSGLLVGAMYMDLYDFDVELFLTIPALIISAVMIFVFNYFITFRDLEKPLRRKMALIYAIATAPYTFAIPSKLIYG